MPQFLFLFPQSSRYYLYITFTRPVPEIPHYFKEIRETIRECKRQPLLCVMDQIVFANLQWVKLKSHVHKFFDIFVLFARLFIYLFIFAFWDRASLCSPCFPRTYSVDQAGLKLRNPPTSASQVLVLKVCSTTGQQEVFFYNFVEEIYWPFK